MLSLASESLYLDKSGSLLLHKVVVKIPEPVYLSIPAVTGAN